MVGGRAGDPGRGRARPARGRRARRRHAHRHRLGGPARRRCPARVERVYAAGGPASIFLYTLAPEKMLGWTRPPSAGGAGLRARRATRSCPRSAGSPGAATPPTWRSCWPRAPTSSSTSARSTATYRSLADRVQQQTGVPYLLFDGSLSAIPRAYARVGDLLGVGERAGELARYAERTLARGRPARGRACRAEQRPSVYYARGPRGLETAARRARSTSRASSGWARATSPRARGGPGRRRLARAGAGLEPRGSSIARSRPSVRAGAHRSRCGASVRAVRDGASTWSRRRRFPGWTSRRR